jgi:hypothetical protein
LPNKWTRRDDLFVLEVAKNTEGRPLSLSLFFLLSSEFGAHVCVYQVSLMLSSSGLTLVSLSIVCLSAFISIMERCATSTSHASLRAGDLRV